jgi:hypothetical protein
MGENSQPPKPETADPYTVKRTLLFLARELRTQQFILRAQVQKQAKLRRQEKETRRHIREIVARIQREMDSHPDIFRNLGD